jgi:NADP-dependent 3-hydroxy acid dehydrogenase YdfG
MGNKPRCPMRTPSAVCGYVSTETRMGGGSPTDRVVLITGGGSGIGAATALELVTAGDTVHILGRDRSRLDDTERRAEAHGGLAGTHQVDVRDPSALSAAVDGITSMHGRLDVLVANAAVHDTMSVRDGNPDWWRVLIETNVLGVLYSCHAVLGQMYRQGSGHIVIIASVSGRITYAGEPVYCASKHATVALADNLRQAVTSDGIRVTCVEPGLVDTPMAENPFARKLRESVHPLDPEDCARAVRFALDQPSHCSINEIVLRGSGQVS